MSKKNENYYYNNFCESAVISCEAAKKLETVLANWNVNNLKKNLDEMHEIEHKGDEKKHEMVAELVSAFITPIERDEILQLSQNIDDVTDFIEDILLHIYICDVSIIREDCFEFIKLLISCCEAMKNMLQEFCKFKKSKTLNGLIIEINRVEEEGDTLYISAMKKLHSTVKDPLEIIAWRDIYGYFEKCFDACEDVADIVESIVIANT